MKKCTTSYSGLFLIIAAILNLLIVNRAASQPIVEGNVSAVLNYGAHGDFQYSPDGKYLAIMANGEIVVWSLESKSYSRSIFDSSYISVFQWRPASEQIAIGNRKGFLKVIDIKTGITDKEFLINNFNTDVNRIQWNPDGTKFLTRSNIYPDTLKIIDYESGEIIAKFDDVYYQNSTCFRWKPDGSKIAFSFYEFVDTTLGKIRIYDVNTKTEIIAKSGSDKEIRDISWSSDGTRIAGVCYDSALYIFDGESGELINNIACTGGIAYTVGWNPFNSKFYFGLSSKQIIKISPDSLVYTELLKSSCYGRISFDMSGGTFAFSGCDKILICRYIEGDTISVINSFIPYEFVVRWNPQKPIITTNSNDLGKVKYWNSDDLTLKKTLLWTGGNLTDIAWSPDGKYLANGYGYTYHTNKNNSEPAGGGGNEITIWDSTYQNVYSIFYQNISQTYVMSWSPDGSQIAAAGGKNDFSPNDEYQIAVSYYDKGQPYLSFTAHKERIIALSWSPDGSKIASRESSGLIKIWSADKGSLLNETSTPILIGDRLYNTISWSPDGKYLAFISGLKSVVTLDVETGALSTLFNNGQVITAIFWNQKADMFAVGTSNGDIHIINTKTWQPVKYLFGHFNQIQSLSWSGDGSRLASSDFSGVMRIWDLSITDVKDEELPISLMSNIIIKPNPASDAAYIDFRLNESIRTEISITDLSGSKVRQVFDGILGSGSYTFSVDTGDLTAGSYFIQLKTNGRIEMRKMIITR
ncbi:MAG: eukaryotic-like serine/threonine-protein kinase [Bacteroidota bacterium]|nr:eukaryotic-like serine/threonine-protein kinase [Bacteroidota bacterium]